MSSIKEIDRMDFTVRPVRREDFGALNRFSTFNNKEIPILLRIGSYAIFKLLDKFDGLGKRLNDPNSKMLMAETSEDIIGYLMGCVLPDRNTGWVQSFYVSPEYRGGIVARRLLSTFEDILMAKGIRSIEAQVLKDSRTHRLAKLTRWVDVQNLSDYEVHIWKTLS